MLTSGTGCYPIHGEAYRRLAAAIRAIDDVAEILVGNREHFWLQLERSRYRRQDEES